MPKPLSPPMTASQLVVRTLNERLAAAPAPELLAAKDEHVAQLNADLTKVKVQLEQARLVGRVVADVRCLLDHTHTHTHTQ
jgi:hypothetical protein